MPRRSETAKSPGSSAQGLYKALFTQVGIVQETASVGGLFHFATEQRLERPRMLQVGEPVHRMPVVADEQRPRAHLLADPVMKQNNKIELAP